MVLKLFQSIVKQWRESHVVKCLNQVQSKLKKKKSIKQWACLLKNLRWQKRFSAVLRIIQKQVYSAVMWSEHCSYKNSKPVLRKFPTTGPQVLQGPGEGAGIVDIGDEQAVVFKIESHNHPSAIEPYQGAATGVGGIIRDVFSMGARPIAMLNSLRFGELDSSARVKYLI